MSAEPLYITLSHSPLKKLNHDHTILLPPLNFWTSPNNPYSPTQSMITLEGAGGEQALGRQGPESFFFPVEGAPLVVPFP